MANETYKLISSVTVGSTPASTIDFTSIPQTYTDLKIVYSLRSNDTNANGGNFFYFQFNGAGFTGLSARIMGGNGSTVFNGTGSLYAYMDPSDYTANTFSNGEFYIPNYTSGYNKTYGVISANENNATNANMALGAGLWSNTSAVTSIRLAPYSGNFVQHSTAYLYGIVNTFGTDVGPQATGGTITTYTSGNTTYWVHTFTSNGTFTPSKSLTCDFLVVGGGGGGGQGRDGGGGGGGAGGVRSSVASTGGGGAVESALSLTAQAYSVTVGNGGGQNTAGGNSVFHTITSNGGGRGGARSGQTSATTGGSGGGQFFLNTTSFAGTAGQGFAGSGGFGSNGAPYWGGGGGGAGSAASNQSGGASINNSISGTSTAYAGGGGGGSDNGSGGGGGAGAGNGGTVFGAGASASIANRGSGGGGGGDAGSNTTSGGSGSAGIVIIRYAV